MSVEKDEEIGRLKTQLATVTKQLHDNMLDQAAKDISQEIAANAGMADILLPSVRARLAIDTRDDKAAVITLDKKGERSFLTIAEQLRSEGGYEICLKPRGGAPSKDSAQDRANDGKPGAVTRSTFEAMDPPTRTAHVKAGGTIVDDLVEQQSTARRGSLPEGTITRDSFNAMSQLERQQHFRDGGKVVD